MSNDDSLPNTTLIALKEAHTFVGFVEKRILELDQDINVTRAHLIS